LEIFLIYAIGDIHGCLAPLKTLLGRLDLGDGDELVFLGDYVDRGPDSKGVVDYLLENRKPNWRFLRGNHEQLLLDWLENPGSVSAATWLLNGGLQTLQSYLPKKDLDELRGEGAYQMLRSAIPANHVEFFNSLPLFYETPEAYFCHAGVDLSKPLAGQTADDLLWIRRKFIQDPRPTPKLVVFGHSPVEKTLLDKDRINLDTGCVYGGFLTALRLPDRTLIQVPYA
jgi:serine/threonine protein phosphatase 1